MIRLKNELANVKTVAIGGHIRPDGDCIGSCLGVWNYIQDNYPDIQADVYLEQIVPKFRFLKGADLVKTDCSEERNYDLFISLDASDRERLGEAVKYLDTAKRSVCVDHHITNPGFADENWIVADASSASELTWEIMEEEKISKHTARRCIWVSLMIPASSSIPTLLRKPCRLREACCQGHQFQSDCG